MDTSALRFSRRSSERRSRIVVPTSSPQLPTSLPTHHGVQIVSLILVGSLIAANILVDLLQLSAPAGTLTSSTTTTTATPWLLHGAEAFGFGTGGGGGGSGCCACPPPMPLCPPSPPCPVVMPPPCPPPAVASPSAAAAPSSATTVCITCGGSGGGGVVGAPVGAAPGGCGGGGPLPAPLLPPPLPPLPSFGTAAAAPLPYATGPQVVQAAQPQPIANAGAGGTYTAFPPQQVATQVQPATSYLPLAPAPVAPAYQQQQGLPTPPPATAVYPPAAPAGGGAPTNSYTSYPNSNQAAARDLEFAAKEGKDPAGGGGTGVADLGKSLLKINPIRIQSVMRSMPPPTASPSSYEDDSAKLPDLEDYDTAAATTTAASFIDATTDPSIRPLSPESLTTPASTLYPFLPKKNDLLPDDYTDLNFKSKTKMAGVPPSQSDELDATGDPKCSSATLRKIMQENIVSSPTISKQLIFSAGRLAFGQSIDVVCSRNRFSYTVVSSRVYCESTRKHITCFAFLQP